MLHNFKYHIRSYLPAIVLISVLLFLPACRQIRERGIFGGKDLKMALLWAEQDSIRVADSLKRVAIVKEVAEKTQQDSIVKLVKEKAPGKDLKNTFHIIIGSFTNPGNAKLAAREYRNKGYKTSIITTTSRDGNKLKLVSVRTFNNYNEAVTYLKEFQAKINSSAWLYPNK